MEMSLNWRARIRLPAARRALIGLLAVVALWAGWGPSASVLRARATAMVTPSGEITRIVIPAIGVHSKVLDVSRVKLDGSTEWQVADYAVGRHSDSGLPGEGTNIVMSGHNNINGEVFRHLNRLRKGDEITLETRSGWPVTYEVAQTRIVLQDGATREQRRRNARFMDPTDTERLTLISCWPYKPWPPYRIIVIAEPAQR
ncbi:MAG: sortase [Chloroflexota bacterium]|nr:sortase [Chloroflexota bacterium]